MARGNRATARDESAIMLYLLDAVARQSSVTQRSLADELGVALGLVNVFIKRAVNRGLIKVQQVPRRRYAYYLTTRGFSEKSTLAARYLVASFEFFRQARRDCDAALRIAADRGWQRLVLVGKSDLAEIVVICASDSHLKVVGVVDDASGSRGQFHGLPVWSRVEDAREHADAVLITALSNTSGAFLQSVAAFGHERVIVPAPLAPAVAGHADQQAAEPK